MPAPILAPRAPPPVPAVPPAPPSAPAAPSRPAERPASPRPSDMAAEEMMRQAQINMMQELQRQQAAARAMAEAQTKKPESPSGPMKKRAKSKRNDEESGDESGDEGKGRREARPYRAIGPPTSPRRLGQVAPEERFNDTTSHADDSESMCNVARSAPPATTSAGPIPISPHAPFPFTEPAEPSPPPYSSLPQPSAPISDNLPQPEHFVHSPTAAPRSPRPPISTAPLSEANVAMLPRGARDVVVRRLAEDEAVRAGIFGALEALGLYGIDAQEPPFTSAVGLAAGAAEMATTLPMLEYDRTDGLSPATSFASLEDLCVDEKSVEDAIQWILSGYKEVEPVVELKAPTEVKRFQPWRNELLPLVNVDGLTHADVQYLHTAPPNSAHRLRRSDDDHVAQQYDLDHHDDHWMRVLEDPPREVDNSALYFYRSSKHHDERDVDANGTWEDLEECMSVLALR